METVARLFTLQNSVTSAMTATAFDFFFIFPFMQVAAQRSWTQRGLLHLHSHYSNIDHSDHIEHIR